MPTDIGIGVVVHMEIFCAMTQVYRTPAYGAFVHIVEGPVSVLMHRCLRSVHIHVPAPGTRRPANLIWHNSGLHRDANMALFALSDVFELETSSTSVRLGSSNPFNYICELLRVNGLYKST